MSNNKIIKLSIAILFMAGMAMLSCSKSSSNSATTTPTVSFRNDIEPILQADCAINSSCHSGTVNRGDNVDFDTTISLSASTANTSYAYSSIISKDLINTTTPTASLLYIQVSTGVMPKSPYSPLNASNITLILNWIKQGAKNN